MLRRRKNAASGFTIVELIIVIIVIGILATIVVVSYRGIQDRAHRVATISAVHQTLEQIESYMAFHKTYPATDGQSINGSVGLFSCVTVDSGCFRDNHTIAVASNPTLNTNLSSLPRSIDSRTRSYGIIYNYQAERIVDGESAPVLLAYYLSGITDDCGVGRVTRGLYTQADLVDRRYTAQFPEANMTSCVVSVPPL